MDKKYKLTEETISVNGRTLYRIEAIKDFGDVKKGDKGGYVENEENLSQSGDCWAYDDAKVYDNSMVFGNAEVCGDAMVCGNAMVYGDAQIYNDAIVCGNAKVYGYAKVFDFAEVYDNAKVYDTAKVYDDAQVYGDAAVCGETRICSDAAVCADSDYILFKNWWSSGRFFTWTKSNNMWKVGCFYGTGKELVEKAYKDSEISGREYERVVKYVEAIMRE